jgi:hypothetical protein
MNLGVITVTLNPPNFDVKDFQTPQEIVEATNLFDQELQHLAAVQGQLAASRGEG